MWSQISPTELRLEFRSTRYSTNQHPYQVSTSYTLKFLRYSPNKIFNLKVNMSRSNQGHTMMMHTYTTNKCPYQVSTSYSLQFLRYSPDKNLKVKVTILWSKIKSRSQYDITYIQPLTNVHIKNQPSTPYRF